MPIITKHTDGQEYYGRSLIKNFSHIVRVKTFWLLPFLSLSVHYTGFHKTYIS